MNQHTGLQFGDVEWLAQAIEQHKCSVWLAHSVKYSLGWLPGILIVTTPSQPINWN